MMPQFPRVRRRHDSVAIATAMLCVCGPAAAQVGDFKGGELAAIGINAAVGGLSAGIGAVLMEHSIPEAIARGLLGGSIGYAGKRLAALDWGPSPAIGRSIAAMGHSVVLNAPRGEALLDSLWIPVGPFHLQFASGSRLRPRVGVNVFDAFVTAYAATRPDLRMDWNRTLRSLVPVFVTDQFRIRYQDRFIRGVAIGGVIVLDESREPSGRIFSHELVHVLQEDFVQAVWERPAESWLRRKVPGLGVVPGFVHAGVVVPGFMEAIDWLGPHPGIITELRQMEAEWFESR